MIYEIKNDVLTAKINDLGAELVSVSDNKTGIEFIWQGDEKYWHGHSPILFPFCGRLFEQRYLYKNKSYKMAKHGFVRKATFKVFSLTSSSITFVYSDNEETYKAYPFHFDFFVSYILTGNKLEFAFKVINKDNHDLFFSLGGHPAFNVPINGEGNFEDYYIEFSKNEYEHRVFSDAALDSNIREPFILNDNKLHLKHSLFDNDAIFLTIKDKKDVITLKSDKYPHFVRMSFSNINNIGFWHANKTDAPFVCMEPAVGFPGRDNVVEDLETKFEVNKVSPKEEYTNSYFVEFVC